MIIFATVLSWLLVQFQVSLQSLHRDEWLWLWANWVTRVVAPLAGDRAASVVTLLLPIAALAAVLALFGDWLFGAAGLALTLAALLYACGRGDYQTACSEQADALFDTMAGTDAAINTTINTDSEPDLQTVVAAASARLNYQAYERWFPVLAWFLILGAPGAVFYRLLACYARGDATPERSSEIDGDLLASHAGQVGQAGDMQSDAQSLLGWFDWVPARLWALACALVGNFSAAFAVLSARFTSVEPTRDLLDAVVLAAADVSLAAQQADQQLEQQLEQQPAMSRAIERCCELNQRVMVVALIIILLIVFII